MDEMLSPAQKLELRLSILEKDATEYMEADELERALKTAVSGMELALEVGDQERKTIFWKLIAFIKRELGDIEAIRR